MRGATLAGGFAIATAVFVGIVLNDARSATSSLGRATPLLLVLALAFGALMIRYSAMGVPVLVAFVYLNLSEALVRYHDFPSLLQLLVLGLAFAAWVERDTERVGVVMHQPLTIFLFAYVFFAFVSTAWAADREIADVRLSALAKAGVLYALATLLMRNRKRLMQGVVAFVASASFLGMLVIWQHATGNVDNELGGLARMKEAHIYGELFRPRSAGPIGDPNFFALVLLLPLPIAILLGFTTKDARARALWMIAAGVNVIALLFTYSRGAIVALALMGVAILQTLHVRWRTTVVVAAVAAAILLASLLLLPESFTQRFITIEQILPSRDAPLHPDSSFQERRLLMNVAWVMFAANPIHGVGIGNYTSRYDDYVGATASAARQYEDPSDLHYPHNLYLEIAAETGLVGLVIFAGLLLACFGALREARRRLRESDPPLAMIAVALQIALAGFLVGSVFLHLATPRYLFLLFAFAASLQRLER